MATPALVLSFLGHRQHLGFSIVLMFRRLVKPKAGSVSCGGDTSWHFRPCLFQEPNYNDPNGAN